MLIASVLVSTEAASAHAVAGACIFPVTLTIDDPGVVYLGDSFQVGVEALIPANKASGTNVGVIAQSHLFLDDLLLNTLGKPLLNF